MDVFAQQETEKTCAEIINSALQNLESCLPNLKPVERAGVLLLSNHKQTMIEEAWGMDVLRHPHLHHRDSEEILISLHEAKNKAEEAFKWSSKIPENLRHLLSLDATILVMGAYRVPHHRSRIVMCWNILHGSRSYIGQALLKLRHWEETTGVLALPPDQNGNYPDDMTAIKTGNRYPEALLPPTVRRR
jgi:hypothetical protein